MAALSDVVEAFQAHPGVLAKRSLALVSEVLGPAGGPAGPGDDTAALPARGTSTLVGGEAIWPPFVAADPFGAGVGAVVANVNDVAAMGGRCQGLVDTVVAPEPVARAVLQGLRFAAGLYDVPIVGGHLTVREGPPSLSVFAVGHATALLSARQAAPGHTLMLAASREGRMHADFPFFSSVDQRGERAAADVALLPRLAEAGHCVAAKDVSMAGLLGSLAMLLEPAGLGARVRLEDIPRPPQVGLAEWLTVFPSYAFLLCAPTAGVKACREAFADRGLACAPIGELDDSGQLRAKLGEQEAVVLDLAEQTVTSLPPRQDVTPGRWPSAGGDDRHR